MKERPIIFNTENVKAILEDRKTQTRRIMKPQPIIDRGFMRWTKGVNSINLDDHADLAIFVCPYGQVGDRLWVRETWCAGCAAEPDRCACYKGLDDGRLPKLFPSCKESIVKPSIHMPRWASRITLEITEIGVERLQEISEEDALAEGITIMRGTWQKFDPKTLKLIGEPHPYTAQYHFEVLWDFLNPKYPWESNPWVWLISFKRVT